MCYKAIINVLTNIALLHFREALLQMVELVNCYFNQKKMRLLVTCCYYYLIFIYFF